MKRLHFSKIISLLLGLSLIFPMTGITCVQADSSGVDLSGILNAPSVSSDETTKIVEVTVNSKDDVIKLSDLGIDIAQVKENSVIILATQETLDMITAHGFNYTIQEEDFLDYLRSKTDRQGTLQKYHTFAQVEKELKSVEQQYPEIAKLSIIGYSTEMRPIYAMKLSVGNTKKPSTLMMGLHHAREWISVEVPLALLKELTSKYNTDPRIKALVDSTNIWIVPVVNPDGLVYSQTQYTMWRKNRSKNAGGSRGVDLNRNYGYKWGGAGASTNPRNETYRGPAPFSEPCTTAIRELGKKEKFRTAISFHSYSNLVLYPYGYAQNVPTPDDGLLNQLAREMATFNGYDPMISSELYPAAGDSDDYLYGDLGVLPFTIELGSEFIPNNSEVDGICKKNVDAALYLIEKSPTVHAYNHPDFTNNPTETPVISFSPVKSSKNISSNQKVLSTWLDHYYYDSNKNAS